MPPSTHLASRSPSSSSTPRLAILLPASLLILIPLITGMLFLVLRKYYRRQYDATSPFCPFRRTQAILSPCLTRMQQIRHRNRGIRARAKALSNSSSKTTRGAHRNRNRNRNHNHIDDISPNPPESPISWSWLSLGSRNYSHRHSDDGKSCLFGTWRGEYTARHASTRDWFSTSRDSNDLPTSRTPDKHRPIGQINSIPSLLLSRSSADSSNLRFDASCCRPPWQWQWQIRSSRRPCFRTNKVTTGNANLNCTCPCPRSLPCTCTCTDSTTSSRDVNDALSRCERKMFPLLKAVLRGGIHRKSHRRNAVVRNSLVGGPLAMHVYHNGENLRRSIGQVTFRAWWDGLDDDGCKSVLDANLGSDKEELDRN